MDKLTIRINAYIVCFILGTAIGFLGYSYTKFYMLKNVSQEIHQSSPIVEPLGDTTNIKIVDPPKAIFEADQGEQIGKNEYLFHNPKLTEYDPETREVISTLKADQAIVVFENGSFSQYEKIQWKGNLKRKIYK